MKHERYLKACVKNGMKIGKNTCIMPGCYFDNDFCSLISIGDNCTLSNEVLILAHDASMYKFLKVAKVARVAIQDNCFIGARAVILPGVTIGPNAIVGAGSVVTKDIPPSSVAGGNPAKKIKSIDDFLGNHKNNFKHKNYRLLENFSSQGIEASYVVKKKDKELVENIMEK
jgi:maltose O-acetyltransferase